MTNKQTEFTADKLPEPGEGRFWNIEFNPRSRRNPMIVQLVESFRPGSPIGRVIGFDYATATERDIVDKAEGILVQCADYKRFIGKYIKE